MRICGHLKRNNFKAMNTVPSRIIQICHSGVPTASFSLLMLLITRGIRFSITKRSSMTLHRVYFWLCLLKTGFHKANFDHDNDKF